jgi:hypothetical protein
MIETWGSGYFAALDCAGSAGIAAALAYWMLRVLTTLSLATLADFCRDFGVARQVSRVLRSQCTEPTANNLDLSGTCSTRGQRLIAAGQHLHAMANANIGRA